MRLSEGGFTFTKNRIKLLGMAGLSLAGAHHRSQVGKFSPTLWMVISEFGVVQSGVKRRRSSDGEAALISTALPAKLTSP
jgi:hypothetical protein